jgi:hypothetical protein
MRRSLVRKKEAGEQDMKLAEEDATADLAEEEVGYHLRGESSSLSLNRFMWTGLLISLFLSFSLLCVPNFPPFNYGSHSSWHLHFCFPLNPHLLCISKWISINISL